MRVWCELLFMYADNCPCCREHTVADGLREVALWNSAQLVSKDLLAVLETMRRRPRPASPASKL